jgi:hypothetical protein
VYIAKTIYKRGYKNKEQNKLENNNNNQLKQVKEVR